MVKQTEASAPKQRNRNPLPLRDMSNLPDWTPIRKHEALSILPISRAGFDNYVKSGKYPPPQYLSPHIPTWTLGVIKQLARGEYAGEAA